MKQLDQYEKRILSAYEKGKLKSVVTSEASLRRYREYARATRTKNRRVNLACPLSTSRISKHERQRKVYHIRPSWRVYCTNSRQAVSASKDRA